MSKAVENLQRAQRLAMAGRPKAGGFPYSGRDPAARGRDPQSLVPASMPESVPNRRWPGRYAGHAAVVRHCGCAAVQPGSAHRCGPTRPGRAPFLNSWPPAGVPALCATTSISRRARSRTTAATGRNTSKTIPPWRSNRRPPARQRCMRTRFVRQQANRFVRNWPRSTREQSGGT
jgi:hypothetical protein